MPSIKDLAKMHDFLIAAQEYISAHREWAGFIIFLSCIGESLLVIGLLIPATALMLFTGGLIGLDILNPIEIGLWGVAGAIVGDAISFYIGRWLGWDITKKPRLARYRPMFVKAKLLFRKYGTMSVFLGRFMGPIRSTIPAIAGVMGLSQSKFQIANILSAIVWVPVMLAPGYFSAKASKQVVEANGSNIGTYLTYFSVFLGVVLFLFLIWPSKKEAKSKSKIIYSNHKIEEIKDDTKKG